MGRWRGYTPEQRDAVRLADKSHRDAAGALLGNELTAARMRAAIAALPASSRIHHYSERNQALLYCQAWARHMTLTDVDSMVGWRQQGRRVRTGERGLRICDESKTGPLVAMCSVFDLAQTEDGTDPHAAPVTGHGRAAA